MTMDLSWKSSIWMMTLNNYFCDYNRVAIAIIEIIIITFN